MPIIGLTGPMCAGKNLAAHIIEDKGFVAIDADKIAHHALSLVQEKVLSAFGKYARDNEISLISEDGSLNRKNLGKILFANPNMLVQHEAIIYPKINELLLQEISKHTHDRLVINAALLHKSPVLELCDFVIFVDSCLFLRFIRAKKRDSLQIRQIFERFSSQKHLFTQYISRNVDIERVNNRGSIRALEKKLTEILSRRGY